MKSIISSIVLRFFGANKFLVYFPPFLNAFPVASLLSCAIVFPVLTFELPNNSPLTTQMSASV